MSQAQSFFSRMLGNSQEPASNDNAITTPDPVTNYEPLLELQDKRQLVRVEVLSQLHPNSYQSMIVRIDFARKEIYLDALTPINPFCPVAIGDTLVVSHHDHGKILSVSGELLSIVTNGDELYYVITLPNEIGYKQRRFYPRLAIDQLSLVKLRLWSPLRIPWHARVSNISAGGARLSIGGNITDQLKKNCILPNCDIELETGQGICCKAVVKAFKYVRRPFEHTEVSVEFSDLGFQQKNWLLQWIDFRSQRAATKAQLS